MMFRLMPQLEELSIVLLEEVVVGLLSLPALGSLELLMPVVPVLVELVLLEEG
jgi:hypothetical protein